MYQINRPRFEINHHFLQINPKKTRTGSADDGIGDDDKDVTTGVTAWCLGVLSGGHARNDTTRPATQVGLRGHEAGLGGHDAGVWRVDAGVEKASTPISKQGRLALSGHPTFSGFVPARKVF